MSFLTNRATLLASTTLGTATNTVTFSNISQGYTAVEIVGIVRDSYVSGSSAEVSLRVNELSTSIYYSNYTGTLMTFLPAPIIAAGNLFSTMFSLFRFKIHMYTSSQNKSVLMSYGFNNSASVWSSAYSGERYDIIATSAAVTSITMTTNNLADNFVANSVFQLWGIP